MCLNVAHCRQLNVLAEAHERVLAIGHEMRLSSLCGKVKERIDAGAIGTPLYLLIELWRKPYRLGARRLALSISSGRQLDSGGADPSDVQSLGDESRFVSADVTRLDDMLRVLDGIDAVVHLAVASGLEGEVEEDAFNQLRFDVNVKGTYNVLEAARRHGTRRVVHTSSIMVTWGYPPHRAHRLRCAAAHGGDLLPDEESGRGRLRPFRPQSRHVRCVLAHPQADRSPGSALARPPSPAAMADLSSI